MIKSSSKGYAGIDCFRMIAAFMVIAIHTSPFLSWNETLDFLITFVICRLAVPFFLTCTGFFVLGSFCEAGKSTSLLRSLHKLLILYGVSTILYLPVNLYAGNLPTSLGELLRMLFFDGTFYQLWYLPATIVGLVFTGFLLRCFSLRTTGILVGVLYIIGLFGDSYYGLTAYIPGLQNLYDFSFQISSYTRNGILFAPAFLWLGAWIHQGHQSKTPGIPFVLSLMFLLTEGYLTWRLNLQRHNSFYVLLPLCAFYLFQLLLYIPGKAHPALRWFSMNLYVIHPFCIAVLLLIFNTVGFGYFLETHSFIHYLLVCALSISGAYTLHFIELLWHRHFKSPAKRFSHREKSF